MSRNQRLYDAIRQSGKTYDEIAAEVDVNRKTVVRWITEGRLPRTDMRRIVAEFLDHPEAFLWPTAPGGAQGAAELVRIYTTRRELSPLTITSLLDEAEHNVDLLAYAALWLWDTVPNFLDEIQHKVAQEVAVRVCLGDPDSDAVRVRGKEEGLDDDLAGRCRVALRYAQGIRHVAPDAVRLTGATLYASMLRFDDHVLLNTHLWGNPAGGSPVFHFRRQRNDGIASNAMNSFERVWESAQPLSDG
jgi:transcriptional regulator with XRE-family HTH domain